MPRTCTVCSHIQRAEIDAALITEEPYRGIAKRFGASEQAMFRHKQGCLAQTISKATDAREALHGDNILDSLNHCATRLHSLFDACHEWLKDPANPDRYNLEPRSTEVNVIYVKKDGDTQQRKKEKLSKLLREVEEGLGIEVERGEYRHADPRELVLKTYDRIQGQLELVAKLIGQLNDAPQINLNVSIEKLQTVILGALQPFPDAKVAVAQALMEARL